jgi:hypothetical protein
MASAPSEYSFKTVKQLRALLKRRRIPTKSLTLKAQLITVLKDHNVLLEAEAHRKQERRLESLKQGENTLRLGPRMRLEDYRALTNNALYRLATQSNLTVHPRTPARLIDALEKDDITWRKRHAAIPMERAREALRNAKRGPRILDQCASHDALWALLFSRDFQAKDARKSFMALPRELRDLVYYHVFNTPDIAGGAQGSKSFDLRYDVDRDRFCCVDKLSDAQSFRRAIDASFVLGTPNRAVRKEARATFWAMARFTLRADGVFARGEAKLQAAHTFAVTERFLRGIGDEGRYGLRVLVVHDWGHVDLSTVGYLVFTQTMAYLAECVGLTKLLLPLDVRLVFSQ